MREIVTAVEMNLLIHNYKMKVDLKYPSGQNG